MNYTAHIIQYVQAGTRIYLWVEDIGVYWLVVIVLVAIFVEAEEGVFEDLVDGGLPSSSRAHTHETVTHQLSLIQLDHFTNLEERCVP